MRIARTITCVRVLCCAFPDSKSCVLHHINSYSMLSRDFSSRVGRAHPRFDLRAALMPSARPASVVAKRMDGHDSGGR